MHKVCKDASGEKNCLNKPVDAFYYRESTKIRFKPAFTLWAPQCNILDIRWLQGQDTKVISQSGKSCKDHSFLFVQSVAPWQAQAEQILSAHMGILCQVLCERMVTNAGS